TAPATPPSTTMSVSLPAPVGSTDVTNLKCATCSGPTHRLQQLPQLNGCHPRAVNAYPQKGGRRDRDPARLGAAVPCRAAPLAARPGTAWLVAAGSVPYWQGRP